MPDQSTRDATRVRDVPRACTCDWAYVTRPSRWLRARADPACIWHARVPA